MNVSWLFLGGWLSIEFEQIDLRKEYDAQIISEKETNTFIPYLDSF